MKLKKNISILLAFLLTVSFSLPLKSQDKQSELVKGVKVSELLKAGDKHKYIVKLEKDQFAFFRLTQEGIDALITTFDPDGKKIQDFDSPNGRKGDELVTLFSDKRGNYSLEVSALEQKGHKGNYELTWEKLEPKGTTPQKQIDQLFAGWNNPQTPGASVAVAKDGKIIFKKGYGSADLEYNIPNTPSTVFHIASLSKQFTAFSILLLEGEGKLSINDDIRKYIPEVPDFGKVITLNQLMHHTSGLRDQWDLLAMAGWRLDDIITKDQILRLVSRQKDLNFNPGDEFLYCNTGFTLLAEVVARVSGQTFAEFTRTHIFEPLKMTSTLFYDDFEKIVKNRAYSYHVDSTGLKKSILSYSTVGATSLFTTVEDLSLWAMNFENPVVGKDVISKMDMKGILNKGDTIGYAMGQGIGVYKGLKFIAHDGADAGYRTSLWRFPDQKFSVNVLSNFASFNPSAMATRIVDIYLKDKEVTESPKKEAEVKTVSKATSDNSIKIDHDTLLSYCGKYELEPGELATISLENENLSVEAPGLEKTPITPVSSTTFDVSVVSARVIFMKDESGKVAKFKAIMNGEERYAMKLPDFDPSKVNLTEYTGDYYSPELSTTYSILVESGKLIARHFRTGDVHLTAIKPDQFTGDRWYFGNIEFVRDNNNAITGCKVSTGRVRNLKFEKMGK
ncbi:MAG: serine hydrolase [Bacteroidales bacterium]|jgi:CubicO group peptidase (beta-lactamase class C family)